MEQHQDKAETALKYAKSLGANEASVSFADGEGFSVTARNRAIETVQDYKDQSFSITVYLDKSVGSASSNNLSESAIKATIDKAFSLSSLTATDDCNGLADKERMAPGAKDLDLYFPWNLDIKEAETMAIECEASALEYDDKVINSEGATVGSYVNQSLYANSHGFSGETKSTGHSISCTAIASDNGLMEMDYDYTSARHYKDLQDHKEIGSLAAKQALDHLGSKKIKTTKAPVVFSPRVSSSLISHLMTAISGSSLYRNASFLVDSKDKKICPEFISIREEPHLKRGFSSCYFDAEGVETVPRCIVENGVLKGYLLSSYSARRLGLDTTGNAGGHHNLIVEPTADENLESMIKNIDSGFLVTGLIGYGVNIVNGDYSRGANGFWIENGEIAYPVSEVTVAGNLKDMLMRINTIGNDPEKKGSIFSGSILIDDLMIAGE
ncbi:MAG: metalloprotease PmbA [Gammaproteobacteria bacterium]|nr:metalloprotease PmbA [Gammaproteobacteria bacterium]GIS86356.1 MAG: peptidase C69 [Woeseia sp.]